MASITEEKGQTMAKVLSLRELFDAYPSSDLLACGPPARNETPADYKSLYFMVSFMNLDVIGRPEMIKWCPGPESNRHAR